MITMGDHRDAPPFLSPSPLLSLSLSLSLSRSSDTMAHSAPLSRWMCWITAPFLPITLPTASEGTQRLSLKEPDTAEMAAHTLYIHTHTHIHTYIHTYIHAARGRGQFTHSLTHSHTHSLTCVHLVRRGSAVALLGHILLTHSLTRSLPHSTAALTRLLTHTLTYCCWRDEGKLGSRRRTSGSGSTDHNATTSHSLLLHTLTHSLTSCSLNSSSKQTRGCSSSARPLPAFAILPVHLFHFRPKNLSALLYL